MPTNFREREFTHYGDVQYVCMWAKTALCHFDRCVEGPLRFVLRDLQRFLQFIAPAVKLLAGRASAIDVRRGIAENSGLRLNRGEDRGHQHTLANRGVIGVVNPRVSFCLPLKAFVRKNVTVDMPAANGVARLIHAIKRPAVGRQLTGINPYAARSSFRGPGAE